MLWTQYTVLRVRLNKLCLCSHACPPLVFAPAAKEGLQRLIEWDRVVNPVPSNLPLRESDASQRWCLPRHHDVAASGLRYWLEKECASKRLAKPTLQGVGLGKLRLERVAHQRPYLPNSVLAGDLAANLRVEVLRTGAGALARDGEAVAQHQHAEG